jgi:hypothetical protein
MTSKHFAALAAIAALAAPTAATAKSDHANSGKATGHAKVKNAVFKGSVVSVDADAKSVVLHVVKANKWGRALKDTDVTFSLAAVKKLTDLTKVAPGASAQAQAKIAKDAAQPFAARKFKVYAPKPAAGSEDSDDSDAGGDTGDAAGAQS